MSKHWLVIIGITLLTGCASGLQVVGMSEPAEANRLVKITTRLWRVFLAVRSPTLVLLTKTSTTRLMTAGVSRLVPSRWVNSKCSTPSSATVSALRNANGGSAVEFCRSTTNRRNPQRILAEAGFTGGGVMIYAFRKGLRRLVLKPQNAQEMLFYALNRHCLSATRMALELRADLNKANQEGRCHCIKWGWKPISQNC